MGAYADERAIAQLLAAYDALDNCRYQFCGGMGEGNRIVGMVTCSTCQGRIYARRALKRMGITDPDNYKPKVRL